MVAIQKIVFLTSAALTVSASPIAAPEAGAVAPLNGKSVLYAIALERRDSSISGIADLVDGLVKFLLATITNLTSLDLATESKDLANILFTVNKDLLQIEEDLKAYPLTSGLGSIIQSTLISTGLQSLVLTLTTFVSDLVSKLATGHGISPELSAQITALHANLLGLENSLKSSGLLGTLDAAIASIVHSLETIL